MWSAGETGAADLSRSSPEASQLTHDHVTHVSAGAPNIFLCVFSVFLSSMWTVSKRPDRRPQSCKSFPPKNFGVAVATFEGKFISPDSAEDG